MTRPIEEMTALHSAFDNIINANTQIMGNFASLNGTTQMVESVAAIQEAVYKPIGLAAINMSNFHIDTSAFQMAAKAMTPPNYMSSIQNALNSLTAMWEGVDIQSPLLNWLDTLDFSPLTRIWEHWDIDGLFKNRYKQLHKLHQRTMYKANWFPYASTLADDTLFDEINEIIFSSHIDENISKRCEKRIDRAILSYYTPKRIKEIKKQWNASDIEPFMKKALGQALEAYLRKEYALMIPFLATMWEGVLTAKDPEYRAKKKESFKKLVAENGYDDVFSDFYNTMIIKTCRSVDDVIDGVPNRHGVAHGWYVKYPTQKAALNAILLTHFVINLKPNSKKDNSTQEDSDNG